MNTVYAICHTKDIRHIGGQYVTHKEDIEQLAIDHYWGILTEPPPSRLEVTVDMVLMVICVVDLSLKMNIEYNILEFEQRIP